MQPKISTRIFKLESQDRFVVVVLVLSCVLLLMSHFLAVRSISQPKLSPGIVQESFKGNDLLRSLEGHLLELEGDVRNLLLLGDPGYAAASEMDLRAVKADVVTLRRVLGRIEGDKVVTHFEELVDEIMRHHKNVLDAYQLHGSQSAIDLLEHNNANSLRDSIFEMAGNLREIHGAEIQSYLGAKTINTIWLKRFNWFSICTIFIIIPFTIFYFIRAVRRRRAAEESRADKEFELAQQFSFIEDLYKKAPIGFHSIAADGTILEMNETELNWLKYERAEVINKMKLSDLLPADASAIEYEINRKLLEDGGFDSMQMHLLCKDGSLLEVLMGCRATFDEEGRLLYSRGAIMDYSERKKLEEDLEQARQSAEKSVMLKEQFVANISHEIRTPLNAILGFSNLLQRTDLHRDQEEFTRNIQLSSENLLAIINDILDFSKIEAGMLHLDKVPFSLSSVINSVRNLFGIKAREKELDFRISIENELPDNLIGDPTRITQILVNLLGNAFKFTEKGKVELSISGMQSESQSIRLQFEVKDTGIGIHQEKIDKIFERFGQATADTTRKFGGTGLGLTITKQLVELQQGVITVSSEVGKGTTFRVEIPYGVASEPMHQRHPDSGGLDPVKHQEVSILIVEDNPMNQRIMELLLDDWGITHLGAHNGLQALEMLQHQVFDMVFMDIQMPEMDGYTTASQIRQKLKLDVPVIATTAHAFAGEREKCISFGMNDYISKPIQPDELYSLILKYSGKSKIDPDGMNELPGDDGTGFDHQYILDITRGREDTIVEMAQLFIDQSAREIATIQNTFDIRDFPGLARAAHSLKSTTAYMGFNKDLGEKVLLLEQMASTGEPDLNKINSLIKQVRASLNRAVEFLRTEFIHIVSR